MLLSVRRAYRPLCVQGLIVLAASLSYISMNMLSKAATTHSAARRIAQDETMSPNTIRKQLQSAPFLPLARSWRRRRFRPRELHRYDSLAAGSFGAWLGTVTRLIVVGYCWGSVVAYGS